METIVPQTETHDAQLEALACKSGEIYALQARLAEYVQGTNDLVSRAQQAEQERDALQIRVRELEDAFERAEDLHLAGLRKELALRLQQMEIYQHEADTFHKAFEIAYKRREQLHNDNVDLSTAVVDLNHINQQLAMRLTQVLELFDAHDLLWEIRDEAGARAAREIVSAARELVGKV